VAGILTEAAGGSELAPPQFVIAGNGVNVVTPAGGFPEQLREVAVALDELGVPAGTTAASFGAGMLAELADVYAVFLADGFAALRAEWLRASVTIGQHVIVNGVLTTVEGLAEDVDAHGRVVVRVADGRLIPVASGDVTLRPPAGGTRA
jgi:BirA family biotin operon repressor/biotin-[acetyl-CoA-carboxylase] ligase